MTFGFGVDEMLAITDRALYFQMGMGWQLSRGCVDKVATVFWVGGGG